MAYESAIEIYLAKLKSTDIKLKPKQNEALQLLYTKENSKVLVKLCTGYRKSIIIQLCPFILGNKCGRLCGIEKPVYTCQPNLSKLLTDWRSISTDFRLQLKKSD